MARDRAHRGAPRPGDRRRLLPGAPRDVGRPAGRHDRRRRRVQLLSDEESRRARRRRRGRHQRRARWPTRLKRLRNGGQTRSLSPPGAGHQLAARRHAGGRPARAAAAPARRGPSAGARWRRATAPRWPARRSQPLPERDPGHVYHLFVVSTDERDALQAHLAASGIETLIHYPVPIPRQPALAAEHPADCPVAARLCDEILSLPLHPALRDDEVDADCRGRARVPAADRRSLTKGQPSASVDHRRGRVHRIPSLRSAARSGARGADPRQPVDRIDRQHRAPQGARPASSTSSTR